MGAEERDRRVIWIFPDYADTVLWFREPVAYDSSGLSQELVRDLEEWERSYYDALGPDLEWRSPELARQFTITGNYLAGRIAEELGHRYEVVFRSYESGVSPRRFRATSPALNPRADEAFSELASNLSTQDKKLVRSAEDLSDSNHDEWFAFTELSGIVYRSDR